MTQSDELRASTYGDEVVGSVAADVSGAPALARTFGVDESRWHVIGFTASSRRAGGSVAAIAVDRTDLDLLDDGLDELAARNGGALPVYFLHAPGVSVADLLATGLSRYSLLGTYRHIDLPLRLAGELDVGEVPAELPDCS